MTYATTPIYNFPLIQQQGQVTRICTWSCTDSLATILTAGYLNPIINLGHAVYANDVFVMTYNSATGPVEGMFTPVISATGVVTLYQFEQGNILRFNTAINFTNLGSAGQVKIFTAAAGMQFQCLDLKLNLGTNFSGGSGDRLLSITDGTTVFSAIPTLTLQTLTQSTWGSTAVPAPASGTWYAPTVAGVSPYIAYSGGANDFTSGASAITSAWLRVA